MIRFAAPEKVNILVVDDDPFIRDILVSILENGDYSVETARNGAEALERYSSDPGRNLILSDMDMPGMNGLELIQKSGRRRQCR